MLIAPAKGQRASMPPILQKIVAEWRNRVETTFKEITDQMELARHGAHNFWGLLTRTAATIAAHTLLMTCLAEEHASLSHAPEQLRRSCRWPRLAGRRVR